MSDKQAMLKQIFDIRRKKRVPKDAGRIEIERFEVQVEKSLSRIEQDRYLAKKFNYDELVDIYKAYEEVTSK